MAALSGHHVTLYEKKEQLGGQVNILIRVPVIFLIRQADRIQIVLLTGMYNNCIMRVWQS